MKQIAARICTSIGWSGAIIIVSCTAVTWLIGCATNKQSGEIAVGTTGKSGAQLWAENCVRCHNIRSPSSLSPAQWEVAMMHMRVRANLTPEEHKKILEFLKAGGGG
jgi:hypothetical protein